MPEEKNVQDLDDQILKQMLQDFLEEALDLLDRLNLNLIQLESEPENKEFVDLIFRLVHTIKGSAGFAGLQEMSLIGRKMEEIFGEVRKGNIAVSPQFLDMMFEALETLSTLRDKAAAGDLSSTDVTNLLNRLDQIADKDDLPAEAEQVSRQEKAPAEDEILSEELFKIYKAGYDQLSSLKHLIYSSIHLTDDVSLAELVSRQILKTMPIESNSIWLVQEPGTITEIASNGKRLPVENRNSIKIDSSEVIARIIDDQLVVWSSSQPEIKDILPTFHAPMIIPLKAQPKALGFIVIDPEETAEVEIFQFVGQFASMILNIARLHQKVEEQRQELDEMTAILFRQNSILSSLYHVELALMNIKNPVDLCRIVAEAFVHDLENRSAAIFLKENEDTLKGLWGSGLQGIDSLSFPVESIEPIRHSLDSGRIVSQQDFPEQLKIGNNSLDNWIIMCLKGREAIHGVVIAELDIDDATDSMSILANYSGILLDNLILQNKIHD